MPSTSPDEVRAGVATADSIAAGLRANGIVPGDIVCAHVGMKSLGLVIGGARTVVEGMIDAVLPGGTLMMATYSGDISDPAEWTHPAVPRESLEEIRAALPAYDPLMTPTRGVGMVAEYFRTYPGARRSPHPQSSFAAWGADAARLVSRHPYSDRFGPQSPLGRLVDLGGKVLLLGAPWDTASLFHLVAHRSGGGGRIAKSAPVMQNGERRWVRYSDIPYPSGWFVEGMARLLSEGIAVKGHVGIAECIVFPARAAVESLSAWRRSLCPPPSLGDEWRIHECA